MTGQAAMKYALATSVAASLVILTATNSLSAAETGDDVAIPAPTTEALPSSVEQLAARGAVAFKAGQFEQSLEYYREAEQVSTHLEERAALAMNQGACLAELGRLAEAKVTFVRAAQFPAAAQKAHLSAALIAVEMDQLDEAERLLAAARPLDEALLSREQDLNKRIAEKRQATRRAELHASIDVAAKAIARADWLVAEKALLEAEARFDVADTHERADVLHGLATTQLALERPVDAKKTLDAALAAKPKDPDLYYAQGRVYEALQERTDARMAYRKALALGLSGAQADNARASIDQLDPLSPTSFFGWLSASVGYDSNPRQSGAATETALGRRGRGGSTYGRLAAELGRSQRIHERVSLGLRYAGEWLGMQQRAVRELSLQNHGAFLDAKWALTDKLVLGLELGPSVTLVGLSDLGPYTWDFMGSLKARYLASNVRTWRASFEARSITGSTDWDFLSGTRLDAELSHGWRYRPLELRLGIRGRNLAIGTRTTTVDATVITACAGVCDGAVYEIPLSYMGAGPFASTRLELHRQLQLAVFGQLDWRQYRHESYIVGVEESRKQRVDTRYNLGVDLRWALDEDEHFVVTPSYALLVSASNVELDSTDTEHLYDYDDRSFAQHFIELGVEASF